MNGKNILTMLVGLLVGAYSQYEAFKQVSYGSRGKEVNFQTTWSLYDSRLLAAKWVRLWEQYLEYPWAP